MLSLSLCNSGGHNCKLSAFGLAFNAADCFIDYCARVCMFVHSSDQMTVVSWVTAIEWELLGDKYKILAISFTVSLCQYLIFVTQ